VSERDITLADGRTLHVYEAGVGDGQAVIAIYGTPSSGLIYDAHAQDAEARGIRLVTFDRAGYGTSDAKPGRSVGDVAADVAAIADELELEHFAVWGVSGGGPHALACAALLPGRVTAAASLAGVAPYGVDGLDWTAGMGEDNIEEFGASVQGRGPLDTYLRAQAAGLAGATVEDLRVVWASLLTPVDAEIASGPHAVYLMESMRRALALGVDGGLDDDLAFVAPWGFELDEIAVPVLLWQGEQDRFVPFSHGRWLAERIPGVEARLTADDGHLTLMEHRVPDVHAWLLERLG
jgi:pimeloyl-ACP methyl ester carboxylesterase